MYKLLHELLSVASIFLYQLTVVKLWPWADWKFKNLWRIVKWRAPDGLKKNYFLFVYSLMFEFSLLISFDVELWISLLSVANKLTWKLCKYYKICQRNWVNRNSSAIFHVHLFNKPIVCNDHVKSRSIYHLLFNSQLFNASFCAFLCEGTRQRKYKMHKFI